MSTLELRIDKYMDADEGAPPQALASILAIDPATGRTRLPANVLRTMVPISIRDQDIRSIHLEPGTYFVEVALPSGEVLADRVEVLLSSDARLVLTAERSPHEWLSWQQLAGNLAPRMATRPVHRAAAEPRSRPEARGAPNKARSARAKATARPVPAGASPKPRGGGMDAALAVVPGAAASRRRPPGPVTLAAPPPPPVATELRVLSKPIPALLGAPGTDPWAALGGMTGSPAELLRQLNGGQEPPRLSALYSDARSASFPVLHGDDLSRGAVALGDVLPRRYLALEQLRGVEVVFLPMPWPQIRSGREAVIDVSVQARLGANEFATSVAVRDEQLSVLLGFLSSGALGRAQEIADTARDMLFGKVQNPLAAAAGAYAMVSTATDSREREWHLWVRNLADWYPHVPDGAILLAHLHLRMRRDPDDLLVATRLFKEGYRRGLPYFTLGVKWLFDGLEKVAQSDHEAEKMLERVRPVAWNTHPQSPFTIVRLKSP